jgi:nucleotide-binding universal stress UspA family protein
MSVARLARLEEKPPGPSDVRISRVVYATDLRATSSKAFNLALDLVRQNNAELVFVHALPPPTPIFEVDSPYRDQAEKELAAMVQRASDFGIVAKRVLIKGSEPVPRTIARCARFFHADLIVIGTGGRTGIARFLAGSMAAKVIKAAPCPVLVARG